MNRRNFLASMGSVAGAALLAPFLQRAWATGGAPCRFVFVVEGNALEPVSLMSTATQAAIGAQATGSITGRRWMPRLYGHGSPLVVQQNDLATAHALAPLADDGSGIDLTQRAAVVLGLSSRITGGGHTTHFGALSSTRSTPTRPGGPTIDAVLAGSPEVRQTAPFDALRIGVDAVTVNVGQTAVPRRIANGTCALGVGTPAPVVLDPVLAFENLFNFLPGYPGHSGFTRRTDQLNFASEDVSHTLSQFAGNSDERRKLEQYLAALDTVYARQSQLELLATTFDTGLTPDATAPHFSSLDFLERLSAQFENATAALLGGLTNVAVITSGTTSGFDRMTYPTITGAYSSVPNQITRHDLHHGSSGQPEWISAIHDISRAHVALIAQLARTLQNTPDGDHGTMLDNTVIVYLSDNGEQHHSTAEEWPVLLVGGDNLGLQTDGRTVVYPGIEHANNRQVSNLWNTVLYAAGLPTDDFGTEGITRIAPGPLSELYS